MLTKEPNETRLEYLVRALCVYMNKNNVPNDYTVDYYGETHDGYSLAYDLTRELGMDSEGLMGKTRETAEEIFEFIFNKVDDAQSILEEIKYDVMSAMESVGVNTLPPVEAENDYLKIKAFVGRENYFFGVHVMLDGFERIFSLSYRDRDGSVCTDALFAHPRETMYIIQHRGTLKNLMLQALKKYAEAFKEEEPC